MKATLDFYPFYCPFCGKRLAPTNASEAKDILNDFQNGESFRCDCGLQFQKATAKDTDEHQWCHERINFLESAVARYRHELIKALGLASESDLDGLLD